MNVCFGRAKTLRYRADAEHLAINVLAADQQPLSEHFAQPNQPTFADVENAKSITGVPRLRICRATSHGRLALQHNRHQTKR
ncbi:MAG: flavin reductase [Gammaproteobacteria bacterium]